MFNKSNESKPIETISDPNTGETIHRVSIPQNLVKEVNGVMATQNQRMQEFVMHNQNYWAIQTRLLELFKQINDGDKAIKDKMTDTLKKAKLDMKLAWQWNLALSCFEYRCPPIVPGMSDADIKSAQNVMPKPNIQVNPSTAVK